MGSEWSRRHADTSRKSTAELEDLREGRLERGEKVGVIDHVLKQRADEEGAYQQDQEDQHNWQVILPHAYAS